MHMAAAAAIFAVMQYISRRRIEADVTMFEMFGCRRMEPLGGRRLAAVCLWSLIGQGGMYIGYVLGDAAGRKTASPDRLCVFGGYVWYVLYVFGDAAETALIEYRNAVFGSCWVGDGGVRCSGRLDDLMTWGCHEIKHSWVMSYTYIGGEVHGDIPWGMGVLHPPKPPRVYSSSKKKFPSNSHLSN